MTEYPNWFETPNAKNPFVLHMAEFYGRSNLNFLQIGAYCGHASTWLLANVLNGDGSVLHDVDTWEGSNEPGHDGMNFSEVEKIYDSNMNLFTNVNKYKMTSTEYLLSARDERFDFIYIDGAHTAEQVIEDAVLSWPLLKMGGIIAFDDYLWPSPDGNEMNSPKPAIDFFLRLHKHEVDVLHNAWQVWLRKR
jgi:predicted O-methyltransferase YrrM